MIIAVITAPRSPLVLGGGNFVGLSTSIDSPVCRDVGAALIAEILLDFFKLLDDHASEHLFRTPDFEVFGDPLLDVGQFVEDLLLLHAVKRWS